MHNENGISPDLLLTVIAVITGIVMLFAISAIGLTEDHNSTFSSSTTRPAMAKSTAVPVAGTAFTRIGDRYTALTARGNTVRCLTELSIPSPGSVCVYKSTPRRTFFVYPDGTTKSHLTGQRLPVVR